MELGLLFFMAYVGTSAGGGLVEGLRGAGLSVFISGIAITIVPTVLGLLYGHRVLKMNPAILLGAIAGGMTSTPALGVVTTSAGSNVPGLGYAGVYAFAVILLTVTGQLMMVFL